MMLHFYDRYEEKRRTETSLECRYNENPGYVVYSAMGSFFIPLAIMVFVYCRIGYVLASRKKRFNNTEVSGVKDGDVTC